jgi:hypothetical protein
MSEEWSIRQGPDTPTITLNGKVLTDEEEIIDFIDTYMKPVDIDILPNPEEECEYLRAFNIFQL